jgi:hypothetical protein
LIPFRIEERGGIMIPSLWEFLHYSFEDFLWVFIPFIPIDFDIEGHDSWYTVLFDSERFFNNIHTYDWFKMFTTWILTTCKIHNQLINRKNPLIITIEVSTC